MLVETYALKRTQTETKRSSTHLLTLLHFIRELFEHIETLLKLKFRFFFTEVISHLLTEGFYFV